MTACGEEQCSLEVAVCAASTVPEMLTVAESAVFGRVTSSTIGPGITYSNIFY